MFQLVYLVGDRGRVAAVARIDLHRHRHAALTGQDPVDHLPLARLAVAAVAEAHQRAGPALVIAGGDVVEHRRRLPQVAPGQLLLDPLLALEQPVHGGIEIVLVGVLDPELLGQGGGVPEPGGGQLGDGLDQPLDDHG